jgi:hypothetical protein
MEEVTPNPILSGIDVCGACEGPRLSHTLIIGVANKLHVGLRVVCEAVERRDQLG